MCPDTPDKGSGSGLSAGALLGELAEDPVGFEPRRRGVFSHHRAMAATGPVARLRDYRGVRRVEHHVSLPALSRESFPE